MKYIKLDLTIGEKIKLLLFGLISEDKLPVNTVEVKEVEYVHTTTNLDKQPPQESINKLDDKIDIPFFDMNDEDVKSNF
jgi:antitoxin component of RelBE/YafQ-DinJ toxin-antitoxin module